MFRLGVLVFLSLVLLDFLLVSTPATAQMKSEGGHGVSHNEKKMPLTRGHSQKASSHGSKGHTGHKPANAHDAYQSNIRPTKIPDNIDVDTTKFSEQARFNVSIVSSLDPITINKMHNWVVQLKNPKGRPVDNANLRISGGMPMHGHGLPTAPQVTKNLGDGKFLVEGVRFNMAGWWELKVAIEDGHHKDKVTFNLVLK